MGRKRFWTYIESDRADMRSEALLDWPTIAELTTWCYHPEAHGFARVEVKVNPPMKIIIFILTRVLVFVIHLTTAQSINLRAISMNKSDQNQTRKQPKNWY